MIHRIKPIIIPKSTADFALGFRYEAKVYRDLKAFRRKKIEGIITAVNMVPTVGANLFLNNAIVTGIASPAFYCSMITGGSTPTFNVADTMASHSGWSEMSSAYVTASTRVLVVWNGSASAGTISNSSSPTSYTVAAAQSFTGQGFFLVDNSTIGGTSGNLLSEAVFDQGAQALSAGNVITITVTGVIVAG
jgi:hypothetical protein